MGLPTLPSKASLTVKDLEKGGETPSSLKDRWKKESKFKEHKKNEHGGKETLGFTLVNLSSRIIVPVIIGVPYALQEAGFGLGVILVFVIAFLTDYTLRLLIEASELSKEYTYYGVMKAAFGSWGLTGVVIKQFTYPFITMIASNIIIADVLTKIVIIIARENDITDIQDDFYGRREFIVGIATLLVTFPLSLYRDITVLSKWAGGSMLFVFVVLIFVIIRLDTLDIPTTPDAYNFVTINVGKSIGILIAVFMCQHSSFTIFDSMINPTDKRLREVAHISVSIGLVTNLAFGIVGYATFTGLAQANILNNYCSTDTLINVGRILFVLAVMLAFPMETIVARSVIERFLFKTQPSPLWRHFLLTVIIVGASVGFSFLTDCLSIMLELNGVANAAPLALIFPPLVVIKLKKKPMCSRENIPLWTVAIVGTGVTVFGLYLWIKTLIDGVACSHGLEPSFCLSSVLGNLTMPGNSSLL